MAAARATAAERQVLCVGREFLVFASSLKLLSRKVEEAGAVQGATGCVGWRRVLCCVLTGLLVASLSLKPKWPNPLRFRLFAPNPISNFSSSPPAISIAQSSALLLGLNCTSDWESIEGKQKPFLLIYLQLSNFLYVFRQTPGAVQIPTDRTPCPSSGQPLSRPPRMRSSRLGSTGPAPLSKKGADGTAMDPRPANSNFEPETKF